MSDRTLDPIEEISASDLRRAAVMLRHWQNQDHDGFNAILSEIAEHQRITEFIHAMLQLVTAMYPGIVRPAAAKLVTKTIIDLARQEVAT